MLWNIGNQRDEKIYIKSNRDDLKHQKQNFNIFHWSRASILKKSMAFQSLRSIFYLNIITSFITLVNNFDVYLNFFNEHPRIMIDLWNNIIFIVQYTLNIGINNFYSLRFLLLVFVLKIKFSYTKVLTFLWYNSLKCNWQLSL